MHTDPEVLALVALGERDAATPEELDHIAHCDSCGRDVDELEHLTPVGRTISDHFTLETPSPEVWNRIRDQLGFQDEFSSELVPPPADDPGTSRRRGDPGRPRPTRPGDAAAGARPGSPPAAHRATQAPTPGRSVSLWPRSWRCWPGVGGHVVWQRSARATPWSPPLP